MKLKMKAMFGLAMLALCFAGGLWQKVGAIRFRNIGYVNDRRILRIYCRDNRRQRRLLLSAADMLEMGFTRNVHDMSFFLTYNF